MSVSLFQTLSSKKRIKKSIGYILYIYDMYPIDSQKENKGDKDKEKETKQNDDGNAEKEEKVCFVQMLFTGMFFFLKLVTS